MIRVIYRWRIAPDHRTEFLRWWHEGTVRIRSECPGAMGSTLGEPTPPGDHLVAVARWRSREDLERFWHNPGGSPFPGAEMEDVEVLEELDHLTLES